MDAIIHHRRQKRFGKSTIGTKMKINPQSLCIALIIYSTSISAADHSHPISFDTYKVGVATKKSSVLPKTTSADATPYISQLNSAARQPINFAGHYILATWGCGSGCVMGGAIDTVTGRVVMLPFTVSNWPLQVVEPLAFQKDSALLVIQGSRNEQGSGIHYYQFDGSQFKLLKTVNH
jgi:hypothetical protein